MTTQAQRSVYVFYTAAELATVATSAAQSLCNCFTNVDGLFSAIKLNRHCLASFITSAKPITLAVSSRESCSNWCSYAAIEQATQLIWRVASKFNLGDFPRSLIKDLDVVGLIQNGLWQHKNSQLSVTVPGSPCFVIENSQEEVRRLALGSIRRLCSYAPYQDSLKNIVEKGEDRLTDILASAIHLLSAIHFVTDGVVTMYRQELYSLRYALNMVQNVIGHAAAPTRELSAPQRVLEKLLTREDWRTADFSVREAIIKRPVIRSPEPRPSK